VFGKPTSDPYVRLTCDAGNGREQKTKTKKKTLDPEFGETFEFPRVAAASATLTLGVYDYDMVGAHDFLGKCHLSLKALAGGGAVSRTLALVGDDGERDKPRGSLVVVAQWRYDPACDDLRVPPPEPLPAPFSAEPYYDEDAAVDYLAPNELRVMVWKGRELLAADAALLSKKGKGSSDPYAQVVLEGGEADPKPVKTKTKKKTLDPEWGEVFVLAGADDGDQTLTVEVYDHDTVGAHDFLGQCRFSLYSLCERTPVVRWHTLLDKDGEEDKARGGVLLMCQWAHNPDRPAAARTGTGLPRLKFDPRDPTFVTEMQAVIADSPNWKVAYGVMVDDEEVKSRAMVKTAARKVTTALKQSDEFRDKGWQGLFQKYDTDSSGNIGRTEFLQVRGQGAAPCC